MSHDTPQTGHCDEHPDRPAAWFCARCQASWCERCVRLYPSGQSTVATCQQCGQSCTAISGSAQRQATPEPDAEEKEEEELPFPRRLIHAWHYPLRGQGWVLLLVGGTFFWVFGLLASWIPLVGFLLGIALAAYYSSYMLTVLADSAAGYRVLPHWPEVRDWWDDLVRPLLVVIGIGVLCMGPALVWEYWQGPGTVANLLLLLGAAYYPMALLAAVLFDSIGAASPLVVIPSILRIPRDYLLGCIGVLALYLVEPLSVVLNEAIPLLGGFVGSVITLYLVVVEMHIIGLLYHTNRYRLGWFERPPEPAA
jgi:hypothetical protein